MQWQPSKIENTTWYGLALILVLTLLRVFTNTPRPCPEFFDCNSYILMVESIAYDPNLLSHHAMRILPSLLVKGLHSLGLSVGMGFRILSDTTYVLFGLLCFNLLRQYVKPLVALSFTLLCLAPHSAMRISLQNVYQSCDILVYPLSLLIAYYSLKHKSTAVFCLSLVGIFVRQNLFVLGVVSLLYLFLQAHHKKGFLYLFTLCLAYFGLQSYYHANLNIAKMAIAPQGFFEMKHIVWIIQDSKIIEILLPMLPIFALFYRSFIPFIIKNWHLALYIAIVVGQPFIAYHLTGNNFARLALQGLWLFYFLVPLSQNKENPQAVNILLLLYAFGIYFSWSSSFRMIWMLGFTMVLIAFYTMQRIRLGALQFKA